MGRKAVLLIFLVLGLFVLTGLLVAAEVKDSFVVSSPKVWPKPTKQHITFNHKKHNTDHKVPCKECHHIYKDGKNVWTEKDKVQKCESCHTNAATTEIAKLPKDQQKLNLYKAFHDNCAGCHKKLAAKDKVKYKDIPVVCAKCHPVKK